MGRYTNIDQGLKQKIAEMFVEKDYGTTEREQGKQFSEEAYNWFAKLTELAKTIIFPAKQVVVFQRAARTYPDSLDYKLPFPAVFIQFDKPVELNLPTTGDSHLSCMVLSQIYDKKLTKHINTAHFWFRQPSTGQYAVASCGWHGDSFPPFDNAESEKFLTMPRAIAICCIGYINCENIYLEKEGEVPEKVNRKRQREGKKILDPYYVCRIKGVKYDSSGYAIGEGTKHGFRYDVRGHFRRYPETGKTTWVRSHQRGLVNELYIPKTYVVLNPPK